MDAAYVAQEFAPTVAQNEAQQHDAQSAKSAQSAQDGAQNLRKRRRKSAQRMSAAQRRLHIVEAGYTDARTIATQFGISLRTAQADLAAIARSS